MELGDQSLAVTLFETFPIRRTWHERKWFYSVIDCMGPLSGSPNPRRYWSDLKRTMLATEQIDVYAIGVHRLHMTTQDGRKQLTDAADTETLLRLVQSVKSPNAEPFKQWLARVGRANVEQQEGNKGLRVEYRYRLELADTSLHQLVSFRGIVTQEQHQALTDANYQGLYDNACEADLRDMRGLWPGDDVRDVMGDLELATNIFQRANTAALIQQQNIVGPGNITRAAYDVGVEIRLTLERIGSVMPEDMPQHKRLSKGEYLPELQDPDEDTE